MKPSLYLLIPILLFSLSFSKKPKYFNELPEEKQKELTEKEYAHPWKKVYDAAMLGLSQGSLSVPLGQENVKFITHYILAGMTQYKVEIRFKENGAKSCKMLLNIGGINPYAPDKLVPLKIKDVFEKDMTPKEDNLYSRVYKKVDEALAE